MYCLNRVSKHHKPPHPPLGLVSVVHWKTYTLYKWHTNHVIPQQIHIPSLSRLDVHRWFQEQSRRMSSWCFYCEHLQRRRYAKISKTKTVNPQSNSLNISQKWWGIAKTTYRTLICWVREDETRWTSMHWCLVVCESSSIHFRSSQNLNLTVNSKWMTCQPEYFFIWIYINML